MSVMTEFECLEQQFLELIGEFRTLSSSESHIREALRTEATKAEAAEAARAAALRIAEEAQNAAAAAKACATQATVEFTTAYELVTGLKIQLEVAERQKTIFEEKFLEMSTQISPLERELQQLRPLQSTQASLQKQYTELQERIHKAIEETRREVTQLEAELRRVERCAAAGAEIRERARLAAAAHSRERRLATAELQHTARELRAANVEISRLSSLVTELQLRMAHEVSKSQTPVDPDKESLAELRAALQAERAGTEKLGKALRAALSDNAALAAQICAKEVTLSQVQQTPPNSASTNIYPIDSFLAE